SVVDADVQRHLLEGKDTGIWSIAVSRDQHPGVRGCQRNNEEEDNQASQHACLPSRGAAIERSHGRRGLLPKRRRAQFSPPLRGGVDATSTKYRAASFMERTGWWSNSTELC